MIGDLISRIPQEWNVTTLFAPLSETYEGLKGYMSDLDVLPSVPSLP